MRHSKSYIRNTRIFYSVPELRNTGGISMWIVARIIQWSLSKPFRPRQLLSYSGTMIVRSHVLCMQLDLPCIWINLRMFGIMPTMKYVWVMRVDFRLHVPVVGWLGIHDSVVYIFFVGGVCLLLLVWLRGKDFITLTVSSVGSYGQLRLNIRTLFKLFKQILLKYLIV